jgi:hypothetical protein
MIKGDGKQMIRILGLLGMAGAFLFISPGLRGSLMRAFEQCIQSLDRYSPTSYVALGVLCVGGFVMSLKSGSAAR